MALKYRKFAFFKKETKLSYKPQIKGVVEKTRIMTPKKPNSARRAVAKIILSNKKFVVAFIPGIGHNLRKHSVVLIRGKGARDLPGVNHSCIRGKYDFNSMLNKSRRRSIYGVKIPDQLKKKIRRKLRQG